MKTKIIIEVETGKMKSYITEDGEDFTKDLEKEWHDKIFEQVEGDITENDNFEEEILNRLDEDGEYFNPKIREFQDIGELSIKIRHEVEDE